VKYLAVTKATWPIKATRCCLSPCGPTSTVGQHSWIDISDN